MSGGPELRTRIERHLAELPVLPTVVVKLMGLDREAENYADEVESLISAEPNFSARVIAAANSASSAPASPITTLAAAVARIGSKRANDLVVALGVTTVFVPRDDWERSLWRHALQVAHASRALANRTNDPPLDGAEAYLAGLLHDIGRFVLFQEAPEQLREVDEGSWDSPKELVDFETAICGMDHTELGALACHAWGIPALIADVVAGHHAVVEGSTTTTDRLTAIVQVADLAMFPSALAAVDGYAAADVATIGEELCPRLPGELSMSAADLHRVIIDVTQEAASVLEDIGLG